MRGILNMCKTMALLIFPYRDEDNNFVVLQIVRKQ